MAPAPRWLGETGQPLAVAQQALEQLRNARQEGLNPQDYQVDLLSEALQTSAVGGVSAEERQRVEAALTQAVTLYLSDLHRGRIDPQSIRENYDPDVRTQYDPAAELGKAVQAGNLAPLWQAAQPQVPMYQGLRSELQRHLRLRNEPAWAAPLPLPVKGRALALDNASQRATVAQRLALLGDLPGNAANEPVTAAAFQAALRSFQARHGIRASGLLDRTTVERLNAAPVETAEHIARNMERLRWAPLQQPDRMVVVNVPEYRLRAYTLAGGKVQHVLPIDVIVGKASSTRTPLFSEGMTRVEFSPYWNVPPSITKKEMLPRLSRDPGYISRNNYEIVGAGGTTTAVNADTLAALSSGRARIRQKPGPGNAMGTVKFVFPNRENIYLHHTSSPGLFQRGQRDLSHGCVRVADPVALAQFVLQGNPQWPQERIRRHMDKRISANAAVEPPIPVILTYITTVIDEDGKLTIQPDIYGQDRVLKQALDKLPARRAPKAPQGFVAPVVPALNEVPASEAPQPVAPVAPAEAPAPVVVSRPAAPRGVVAPRAVVPAATTPATPQPLLLPQPTTDAMSAGGKFQ
ncbi:MAG: L,D-transpeptidase family protein [Brachymonas sp.]|nr:L,D-transpeptidase family protein [Brachymonas sp.]